MVPCRLPSSWERLWPKRKKMPRGEYISSSFAECAPECEQLLHGLDAGALDSYAACQFAEGQRKQRSWLAGPLGLRGGPGSFPYLRCSSLRPRCLDRSVLTVQLQAGSK